MHGVGGPEAQYPVGGEPLVVDDPAQQGLCVGKHLARLLPHHLVIQNGRIFSGQIPGLEKRRPVDVRLQFGQVKIPELAPANEGGFGRLVTLPVDGGLVGAGPCQRPQGHRFFAGVQLAHPVVIGLQLLHKRLQRFAQQALCHAHAARGVGHVDHRAIVMRCNFHGGVHTAGGGAANQQRNLFDAEVLVLLHLIGHVLHLFQAGGNQAAQADDVGAFHLGLGQNFVAGHHHAHVHHVKVVALQDHRDDILADVVHVALDRGHHDLALAPDILACGLVAFFFGFDVGQQVRHGLLHHAGRFDHLRQKHLALAEQIAHHIHAGHQRAFNHVQRAAAFLHDLLVGLFGVLGDEVGNAMHQRVAQARVDGRRVFGCSPPLQFLRIVLGRAAGTFGDLQQALGRVGAAVQHHIFHARAQLGLQLVVHTDHARVDNAHIHARGNRVVQKHGVDRLAHRVVSAETETHVAHAAAHLGAGQMLLDPAHRLDKVHGVVGVLLNAGGNRKNIGVEDDVFGRKPHLVHQHAVGAFANGDLACIGIGLALLIKRHHHGGRAVAFAKRGLALELGRALFQADRIHNTLALQAAQSGLNHAPFGTVDHHRHARNVGLAGHQVEKLHHRRLAVEHGLVHVHVHHLRAVFHLLARHGQRLFVLAVQNHARKRLGAGDVGALANIDEQAVIAND